MIPSLRIFFLTFGLLLSAGAPAQSPSPAAPPSSSATEGVTEDTDPNSPGVPNNPGAPQQQVISQISSRYERRDRNAPRRDNIEAFRVQKHVYALLNGFEMGAGLGLGVELTSADKIPGVEFRSKFMITTRAYRRLEAAAYLPKVGDSQTHAEIWFGYLYRLRDNIFGLGPRTPDSLETNFASDYRSYNGLLYRDFTPRLQAGVFTSLINSNAYNGTDQSEAPVNLIFSGQPTVTPITRWLPGLNNNAKLLNYGAYAQYDARNNERGLTKGGLFYGRFGSFDGLKNAAFSDFGWNEINLDGRAYIPLGSDFTSLALRAYTELLNPKGGSQIPFYFQPWLGGRRYLRGFDDYRFRGNNLLLFSVEPRRTVWKQSEIKGIDVFAFGDAGQVWGDSRSRTDPQVLANDRMSSSNWRFGLGGGAEYRMSKNFSFRVDLGHSNETNKVYFSVSRGF